MGLNSKWFAMGYQVNGVTYAIASHRWLPQSLVTGLNGEVILSRWWALVWESPGLGAEEQAVLLALLGSAVTVVSPGLTSAGSFVTYASAVLESLEGEQNAANILWTKAKFRVYV